MKTLVLLAVLAAGIDGGTSLQAQQPEPRLTVQFENAQLLRLTSALRVAEDKQVMLNVKLIASSPRTRRIALMRNARKNGFTTRREGKTIYFQAQGVEDPLTKKLLEGLKVLQYRCPASQEWLEVDLTIEFGRSREVKVACEVDGSPIVVESLPEPAPGSN